MHHRAWLAAILLTACGDNLVIPPEFGDPGSLTAPSGRGGFRFGAASAATQIEDQNPATDWYLFTRPQDQGGLGQHTFIGDAARGYTRAIDDVRLLTDAHLDAYRFSIEWARIEPERDKIDEAALAHYDALIDALIAAGIRPMITIHHFSNPVWVDDPRVATCDQPSDANLCGLGHPQGGALVIEEMAEHARLLAARYGDRVDEWGTLNEPVNYLIASHGVGVFPPGRLTIFQLFERFIPVVRDFLAAHAAMYAAIKEADTIDADHDGVAAAVGLTLNVADWQPSNGNEPSTDPMDVAARDRIVYIYHYLVVDALTQGKFDPDLDGILDEDQPTWRNTIDWLGIQYYFRAGVSGHRPAIPDLKLTPCSGGFDFGSCLPPEHGSWCVPTMGYELHIDGIYDVLTGYHQRYPGLPLVVSESGLATEIGERRAEHIVRTLEAIARARADGLDVRGYYHWSLYDNFEWQEGFTPRFGLYRVDYTTYERTPTLGAQVLGEIAAARALPNALRERYGGKGLMTREPGVRDNTRTCLGLE